MEQSGPIHSSANKREESTALFTHFSRYLLCEEYQLHTPARILCSSNTFTKEHPGEILIYHHHHTHILSVPFPLIGLMGPIVEKLPPHKSNWAEKIQHILHDRKEISGWVRFQDWYRIRPPKPTDPITERRTPQTLDPLAALPPTPPPNCLEIQPPEAGAILNHQHLEERFGRAPMLRIRLKEDQKDQEEALRESGFKHLFTWEIIRIEK